jgi:predicted GIY-YIG superfamily endonuclease
MSAATNVYVFKSDHGLVKIGMAADPLRRAKAIQATSGLAINVAHTREIKNALAVEHAAHVLLKAKRRNGEWFDVTVEEAIQAIELAIDLVAQADANPKLTKCVAVIFRCTPAKRAQLLELADELDISIAQTMEQALDALRREVDRKKKKQERAA